MNTVGTTSPPASALADPATSATPVLRIAFLPFYVSYYEGVCSTFPAEKQEVAARAADRLGAVGEVLWDGQLLADADAAAQRGSALATQRPDVVVVLTTIAVFGSLPLAALDRLPGVPVIIWNAQQLRTVDDGYSMVDIVRNTGQIGTQALANTLLRRGRWFHVVSGHEGSTDALGHLGRLARVAAVAGAVRRARLLCVGEPFPGMTDVELDDEALASTIGTTVTRVGSEQFNVCHAAVTAEAVEVEASDARGRHPVDPSLSTDALRRSARISVALQALVATHDADGGSINCHGGNCLQNPRIGVTACYAIGVQNRRGRPFTCTGDLPTALAMLLVKRLTGAAMYTEVQVADERRGAVVIANSGEGEPAIGRPGHPQTLRGNTNFAGLHGRGASFAYPLAAGPATLVSLTPTPAGPRAWRLIVAEGEILNDVLPDAGALAGFFRFAHASLDEGYRTWMGSGAVHHAATTVGHWAEDLRGVADLLQMEFVEVRK